MDVPYVAFVGGSETYGRFIKAPFPALIESDLGVNCINFGVLNAGLDVFVNEGFFSEAASGAAVTVLQIVGTQNMSNRFYTVHPRRNDRFLDASAMLKTVYPEVDFSEFNFTKHMLTKLYEVSRERFSIVRRELQIAWVARMKMLLRRFDGEVILLWFAENPPAADDSGDPGPASSEPLFVTRKMLSELYAHTSGLVEVSASPEALAAGTKGMIFNEMEAPAAQKTMGPRAHGEVAQGLGPVLGDLVTKKGRY